MKFQYISFFIVTFLMCNYQFSSAQRPNSDFISICGPTTVSKYIPVEEKSIEAIAFNPKLDSIQVYLIKDDFCFEGQAISLVKYLQDNPLVKIEISAHTHSRATQPAITKTWAENVKRYLLKNGIESGRMETVGKGKAELLISDTKLNAAATKAEKDAIDQINTRIEIKIIGDQYKSWFGVGDQKFYVGQKLDPALGDQLSRQYHTLFNEEQGTHPPDYYQATRDSSHRILNVLAIFLQTHPEIKITIELQATKKTEFEKHSQKANSQIIYIKAYLIKKGCKANQLLTNASVKITSEKIESEYKLVISINKGN